jgi:hypothetical protein
MGTSTSSKGPGSSNPLVPPWADIDGAGPGPEPVANRFQGFRTELGKFVSSGDRAHLRKALRHYARSSTGGSDVGPRRFGSMAQAGGALFGVLNQLRSDPTKAPFNLRALAGRPTQEAIDAIVEALVPENGDAERIRSAMNDALSACLEGVEAFDFANITDELLTSVMITYVIRCVFEQIVLDSDRAFGKATRPEQVERAEIDLLELISVVTDQHMRPLLDGSNQELTNAQIQAAEFAAIREVWKEWEGYVP